MAVLPQNLTNEYGDDGVATAATEVIGGITYEVIYLDGDNAANLAKLYACSQNTNSNYRYVLTANWRLTEGSNPSGNAAVYGNNVILDLNGFAYTSISGALCLYVHRFEVTDTSKAQTGLLLNRDDGNGQNAIFAPFSPCQTSVISGGTCTSMRIHNYVVGGEIIFQGGNYTAAKGCPLVESGNTHAPFNLLLAPYMAATYNAAGQLTSVKSYDYYAVSTSDLASGAYNYAYGYKWELNVAGLRNLTIPADKTYYLWARNKDGWYEYLNLRYADGAWQNAA